MPLARVRVELYGTRAQLTQARSAITSQYPQANKIYDRNDGSITNVGGGLFGLTVDCRLNLKNDGDALWAKVQSQVAAVRATGVTGRVTYHQCSHLDGAVVPCVDLEVAAI